jgi:wyosine [tRNA(Phe)-imidazoG37] synthetase (radical SAM superfamily)
MLLEQELRGFMHQLLCGDFMQRHVPEEMRRINDIALSGNGEPTSAQEFTQVIQLIVKLKQERVLPDELKLVLITNGSLIHRENVQQGLRLMAQHGGEVWFKLDRASESGMQQVNDTRTRIENVRENLATCITLCPTWIQTCWFAFDGFAPAEQDEIDYLKFLADILSADIKPRGVLLYSLARPSLQPEAIHLAALKPIQMEAFAERIRALGLAVKVSL